MIKYLLIILIPFSVISNNEDHPYLTNFTGAECDSTIFSKDSIRASITSYYQGSDGNIQLRIKVGENCAKVQTGSLEVIGDTLNLKYDGLQRFKTTVFENDSIISEIETVTEPYAFCDCLFNLFYEIKAPLNKQYVFTLNGEELLWIDDKPY